MWPPVLRAASGMRWSGVQTRRYSSPALWSIVRADGSEKMGPHEDSLLVGTQCQGDAADSAGEADEPRGVEQLHAGPAAEVDDCFAGCEVGELEEVADASN